MSEPKIGIKISISFYADSQYEVDRELVFQRHNCNSALHLVDECIAALRGSGITDSAIAQTLLSKLTPPATVPQEEPVVAVSGDNQSNSEPEWQVCESQ